MFANWHAYYKTATVTVEFSVAISEQTMIQAVIVLLAVLRLSSSTVIIENKENDTSLIGGIPSGCHCMDSDTDGVKSATIPSEGSAVKCSQIECESLDVALNYTSSINKPVAVNISSGTHELNYSYQFKNRAKLCLRGQSSLHVFVECADTGLAFTGSTDINISGICFIGCKMQHQNDYVIMPLAAALYFLNCKHITITGIRVVNTNGTGLVMFNTTGQNMISDSQFSRCVTRNGDIGGGGMRIVLSGQEHAVAAGKLTNASSSYTIINSSFIENEAYSPYRWATSPNSEIDSNSLITSGMGGGLFVCLGTYASNILVRVVDCLFENNMANQGGGLSVLLLDKNEDNNIIIANSNFTSNNCTAQVLPPSRLVIGGGIALTFFATSKRNIVTLTKNNFTGNSAYYGGALSVVSGKNELCNVQDKNHFNMTWCNFEHNVGRIGAAVDFYCKPYPAETKASCSVLPLISDTNFTSNCGQYTYEESDSRSEAAIGRTFATLNIQYLPTKLNGNVLFQDNLASGIGIQDSEVVHEQNSVIRFEGNIAKIGGGMALIGKSTVILNSNTTVIFENNTATESGGAIFVSQSSQERYIAYDYTCFFQHSNPSLHPNRWKEDNISISFSGNNIAFVTSNAIFASSILPCVWPSSNFSESTDLSVESDINSTFCEWSSWEFDLLGMNINCSDLIVTASARFAQQQYNVYVSPGILTNISNFVAYDDLGHDVTNTTLYTISVHTKGHDELPQLTISNQGEIMVVGKENTSLSSILQSVNSRSAITTVNIHVIPCPSGSHWNPATQKCDCSILSFSGNLLCDRLSLQSILFIGTCISYWNEDKDKNGSNPVLVVARCPYLLDQLDAGAYRPIPVNASQLTLDEQFCKPANRKGRLCGECISGHGINIYSPTFKCVNCTKVEPYFQWLKVVLITVIPITLFFVIVTVFHIGVTSASMSGYIFVSNVMTIPLQVLIFNFSGTIQNQYDNTTNLKLLNGFLFFPYRIWNLQFAQIILPYTSQICLHESFKVVHVLALEYLSAFYPLFLVIVTYILIELQARNCKPLVWLWRPLYYVCVRFRNNWELRTSIIDAFATFLLLSYSRLVSVSIALLAPNEVYNASGDHVSKTLHYDTSVTYFSRDHIPFAVLAITILLTFGAIPPILLILYPFKWFQKVLNRCNLNRVGLRVFVDAFQGSFKNGTDGTPERRYFAGIYFIFRIVVLIIYSLPAMLTSLYTYLTEAYIIFVFIIVLFRPYRNNYYNVLDAFFLTILAILSCLILFCIMFVMQYKQLPHPGWEFMYILAYIPTLYIIGLFLYLLCVRSRLIQRHIKPRVSRIVNIIRRTEPYSDYNYYIHSDQLSEEFISERSSRRSTTLGSSVCSQDMQEFPDRLENPHRYDDNNSSFMNTKSDYSCRSRLLLRSDQEQGSKVGEIDNKSTPSY